MPVLPLVPFAPRPGRMAALAAAFVLLASCNSNDSTGGSGTYAPHTRTYYVAAEKTIWNYAPIGYDSVYDQATPGPWGDSLRYNKLRYFQYTDGTFATRVAQPEWLGILGPIIRGVVGDTIKVVFRNRTDQPLSMHPHGVDYKPEDEGAFYNPPRGGGGAVDPGTSYTYTWLAGTQSGPLSGEPSSKVWLYHSHVMDGAEIQAGLEGVIVITAAAHARADATPDDVDKEFVTFWMIFNENQDPPDEALEETNLKHSINGLFFDELKGLNMKVGDRVRWYLVALGNEQDLHTPHWHGNKLLLEGRTYTDVVELLPASMHVGDMLAVNPGRWLLHCHVMDHFDAGMYTLYNVTGAGGASLRAPDQGTGDDSWFPFSDVGRSRSIPASKHRH